MLVDKIDVGEYGRIHSLVIVRNEHIARESYFLGHDRNSTHCIYSDTKSVTSALPGIARGQGLIDNLDSPILEFLPPPATMTSSKTTLSDFYGKIFSPQLQIKIIL